MCCFSRPVRHVSQTRIFARPAQDGRQLLVYSMNVSLAEDLAMVLPLPVPPGSPEDAVRFIDLSAYPAFFDDLGKGFPEFMLPPKRGGFLPQGPDKPRLRVHPVGDFEASFVPTVRDFNRLDERFRLPAGVWDKLPGVRDHGFAVFKLRRPRGLLGWLRRQRTIHPMAFEFPRRDRASLFFPTVHVHDGEVHPEADFDHSLYCQPDPDMALLLDWEQSAKPLQSYMDVSRAAGVVDGAAPAFRQVMLGRAPNRDVMITEADLRAATALGELFLLRIVDPGRSGSWPALRPEERARLKEAIAGKLRELTRARRDEWGLARYRGDLPERWPTLVDAVGRRSAAPLGEPCRLKFFVWSQRVAPHEISLAFRDEPPREQRDAIHAELQQALDEAAA